MASMFLGASAAAHDGPLAPGWLTLTVLGIFAIEVAKNASGDIVDFRSGADLAVAAEDRSPFSGGKRVIVDGLLTVRQTAVTAAVAYLLGIAAGLLIVAVRTPQVFWLGVAGVTLAFFYHAPPLRLSYRGLGELAVAITYGPLICAGTYIVQRGVLQPGVLWLSLPLGMLIGAFLWVNEFPDFRADLQAGKRTLVVRLGRKRAGRVFAGVVVVSLVILALLPAAGLPRTVWLGGIAVWPTSVAVRTVLAVPESTPHLVPAQGRTLLSFVLLALGSGVGLLITP